MTGVQRQANARWLRDMPVAHRGLHDVGQSVPENSLAAFAAAADAGYAIELDLRMSRDGEAVVFHDETLERLTSCEGPLRHRSAADLRRIPLLGGAHMIPTLPDVLDLVRGRAPLLIEIKAPTRRVGRLEAHVAALLQSYSGPFAIQSFNPLCVRWFRDNAPEIHRGLLSARYSEKDLSTAKFAPSALTRFALRHLLTVPSVAPHFVAYEVDALPALAPWITKHLGLPLLAWTVRSERQREIGARHADNIIFEGFRPPLRRHD